VAGGLEKMPNLQRSTPAGEILCGRGGINRLPA